MSEMNRREFVAVAGACLACAMCPARLVRAAEGAVDVGELKSFKKDGISEKFLDAGFFVVRDQGKLFAPTGVCTHKKNLLLVFPKDKTKIVCSGHDSKFSAQGVPLEGPAKKPLPRFKITVNEKGRVLVDPEVFFEEKDWGKEGAFIKVE